MVEAPVEGRAAILAKAEGPFGTPAGFSNVVPVALAADADGDGVDGEVEGFAPHGGDGNQDGVPDRWQADVVSLPSPVTGDFITLEARGKALGKVRMFRPHGPAFRGASLPYGLVSFEIAGLEPGASATVRMILPGHARPEAYLKQDPHTGRISRFDYDGTTGAVITGNVVTLHLLDGGRGDFDGVANGVIVDPGGPGSFSISYLVTNGLEGWTIVESGGSDTGRGSVTFESGDTYDTLVIREGDSFLVSLERDIGIPENPGIFRFLYETSFDTADGHSINDAFEVALVDAEGSPVVLPFQAERDSYINDTEQEPVALGAGTTLVDRTVDLDISGLSPGDVYRLKLRLVNNDQDVNTTVRITCNYLPTARHDNYTIPEDNGPTDLYVLANDTTDPDLGETLSIVAYDASNVTGTLSLVGGTRFQYTGPQDYYGTETFTYTVSDGTEGSQDSATVTIQVEPVNDPPVARPDSYTVDEDTVLAIGQTADGLLANDSDVEQDPLTARRVAPPAHGTVTVNPDGTFTYTPNPDFNGTDTFTYQANDGKADSAVATVTITVNPVNDVVANDDAYGVDEDNVLAVGAADGLLANDYDAEGDPMTAQLLTGQGYGPFDGQLTQFNGDGSFTYEPNENFNGQDTFTYQAYDGIDLSVPATVTISVAAVNDAPVAAADSYTTDEDTALLIGQTADGLLANDSDVEGDALTAVNPSDPPGGSVTLQADGTFTYTPDA
ncbi:MAG TPA: tandem-95 repeat protein, partial [Planctomycetaceae bacterium]|nr:tandem-95 repeat protein [Planctomycetaceae bacterium]